MAPDNNWTLCLPNRDHVPVRRGQRMGTGVWLLRREQTLSGRLLAANERTFLT